MCKIEVGMRVRCVATRESGRWFSKGAEGIVVPGDGSGVCVKFDSGDYREPQGLGGWWGEYDQFEIVEDQA